MTFVVKRPFDAPVPAWSARPKTRGEFARILVAFMLRDMRTRFGRSYASYLLSIGWPLSHLGVIFMIYVLTHKLAPIGDDPAIFASTGLAPYILCLYPGRFLSMAILQNKPLLQFPVVSPLHLVLSRAVIEILSAFLVFFIFIGLLAAFGVAAEPLDISLAAGAIASTLYLSIGIGVFGIILVSYQPMVGILTIVFLVLAMYLTSDAVIPLSMAPASVHALFWFNPLYQAVAILRSSYFYGYDANDYSLLYIILCGSGFLLVGLLGERLLRGRLLAP